MLMPATLTSWRLAFSSQLLKAMPVASLFQLDCLAIDLPWFLRCIMLYILIYSDKHRGKSICDWCALILPFHTLSFCPEGFGYCKGSRWSLSGRSLGVCVVRRRAVDFMHITERNVTEEPVLG